MSAPTLVSAGTHHKTRLSKWLVGVAAGAAIETLAPGTGTLEGAGL